MSHIATGLSSTHLNIMVPESMITLLILSLAGLMPTAANEEDEGNLPRFVEKVPNITVTVGRDALLPCTVEQLKGFKVAWVQVDTQTILTIHKQVITRNPRIDLLHNDHRTWHLQLKNVRESDRGWYMCQVNTDPMRYRQGYVDVVVPPDIIDRDSSGDLTVREGEDVTLTCRAKGHPTPSIVWRREDNQDIVLDTESADLVGIDNGMKPASSRIIEGGVGGGVGIGGGMRVGRGGNGRSNNAIGRLGGGTGGATGAFKEVKGEVLELKKVSRLQMGSYLCIASNGIPPSISKRANLRVQFPPMAWVPQQLEGAYVGQELTIECHTEAFPKSINYWTNTNGDMIVAGDRYEPFVAENSYKVFMKLRIKRVEPEDYGLFRCVAKNSLGETDGEIKVYEIPPPKSYVNAIPEDHVPGSSGNNDNNDDNNKNNNDFEIITTASSDSHGKERKKYEDMIHPKGINELTDSHRSGKTYKPKDSDLQYVPGLIPGFNGSSGQPRVAIPNLCVTAFLSMVWSFLLMIFP